MAKFHQAPWLGLALALLLTAMGSFFLWWNFRLRNPAIDNDDAFRYIANGLSLLNSRHPFLQPESYTDFTNGSDAAAHAASYPNQLYSLTVAVLCKAFSAREGRFVLWPILIPSLAATVIGFCFLYLLFRRFLPEHDVWLGLALLGFHSLLMTSLTRPLSDSAGWCFAMALFWLAVCRPFSPWALGAVFGIALLFRLQLLLLLPFLVGLAQSASSPRNLLPAFLKTAAAALAVVLLFECCMRLYIQLPPGSNIDNTFGNATYYVRTVSHSLDHFGSLSHALVNFGDSLLKLFRPIDNKAIGLSLLISLAVWMGRNETLLQKQARILWITAFSGSLLPLLLYASDNNLCPGERYQIYSIPLYVLIALFSLNGIAALSRKKALGYGLKGLLVVLTIAGCFLFPRQPFLRRTPYFRSLREIYADFESLPNRLAQKKMPPDGQYLVKTAMDAFLPDCRLILLPPFTEFRKGGRNHELDGLIISPNLKGWGKIGSVIEDDCGVRFTRVYDGRGKGHLVIFKREPPAPADGKPRMPSETAVKPLK